MIFAQYKFNKLLFELKYRGRKKEGVDMIRYYLFCMKWLWKNRTWRNTRQKFKAMERAYADYVVKRCTKK